HTTPFRSEAWLARARNAPVGADDALLRSIHTMNGAFAMTEVPSITDVTTQAEAFARRLLASGQDADADGVDGISGVVDAIRSTIQALALPEPRIPLFTPLVARMAELCDRLPEENQSICAAGASAAESELPDGAGLDSGEVDEADLAALDLSAFTDLAEAVPVDDGPKAVADEFRIEFDAGVEAEPEPEQAPGQEVDEAAGDAPADPDAAAIDAAGIDADEVARNEAALLEAERLRAEAEEAAEYARLEAEYAEQARTERQQAAEAERAEAERLEAERLEAERLEAERLEAERLEAERLETERLEAE